MKSQNFKQADKLYFGTLAIIVLAGLGLLLAVYTPQIKSWQMVEADKIINLATKAQDKDKVGYLGQAVLLNNGDPLATEYLAEHYRQVGDYKKAISTYQSSPYSSGSLYAGDLALKIGDYSLAERLYAKANQKSGSAESLAGLALVKLAQGKTEEGCEEVGEAEKQNLSSPKVAEVIIICNIQNGSSKLTAKQQAYAYAKAGITDRAIDLLGGLKTKSTGDWLILSNLFKIKGDSQKSIGAIESGLEANPTNKELLTKVIFELKQRGDTNTVLKNYENRLDDLQFKNFQ